MASLDVKTLREQLDKVVNLTSISSANPAIDTSNKPVIDYLATQFEALVSTAKLSHLTLAAKSSIY